MTYRLIDGIPVFGTTEPDVLQQMKDVKYHAVHTALMADNQLGYVMPVGGVAAYRNQVSVIGVGVDIACGNAAIQTDLCSQDMPIDRKALANEIQNTISFGMGRKNAADDAPTTHALFDDPAWDIVPNAHRNKLKDKARAQLGTVGGGNHYVDVFTDEGNSVWVGVHFGSRGFGFTVAQSLMAMAHGKTWEEKVPEQETLLSLASELGVMYWDLMTLAGRYAYAGREWVARKVVQILGGREIDLVHNHHNFAWREVHHGEELIVVRKGATPAFPGQRGFVGGSMGDQAVILQGKGGEVSDEQWQSLFSTVHGAGRVMGRNDAKRGRAIRDPENPKKVLRRATEERITREMMNAWLEEKGVILRGGEVDEAPQAYRRLPDVLAAQGDTVEILRTLTPIIVVMADSRTHDAYKD